MAGRKRGDIPKSLARGRDRFEAWRRSRKVGARIPNKLWSLAVNLAEETSFFHAEKIQKMRLHPSQARLVRSDMH